MNVPLRRVIGAWTVFVLMCAIIVSRTEFHADMSAFLPRSPTPAQQVLVEQLRDGVVSRLILIGIEGDTPQALAKISRRLAAQVRGENSFVAVNNGEDAGFEKDREYLWRNRYLLSPAVSAERFSIAALRSALEENLQLLGSPAGMFLRRTLPSDPSGELLRLIEQLELQGRPAKQDGVWFSGDGKRALLIAQTRAAGYDIDEQMRAQALLRSAFKTAADGSRAQLLMTGPAVFSVNARDSIKGDVWRFSVIATLLIAMLLLALYRSPRVLGLGLLPVATGALAGVAAVSLGFGSVHGITLGFGVTLIGEGVDYAIYLFTQNVPGTHPYRTLDRVWPTLRLGVLTSISGFSAMVLSGFPGLAQLGLFSIVGLAVAATVTRWVLPALLPAGFSASGVATLGPHAMRVLRGAPALRYPLLFVVMAAATFLFAQRGSLWSEDLASLSPVPAADQQLDLQLRRDMGAPDVRHLIVVDAENEEEALQASERVAAVLDASVRQGWLQGYESPATLLPSRSTQLARRAALPAPAVIRANLGQALQGLPFRANLFEPFFADLRAVESAPLLDRTSLQETSFALKLDALLVKRPQGWLAMLPLRNVTDADAIAGRIDGMPETRAKLLDLKRESDRLYQAYRQEALAHSLLGGAAIVALLFVSLRSPRRVFDVLAPLVAAVVVTMGVLALGGKLSIFHLVGLLLVVAVGSNYSLFFDRQVSSARHRERTVVSLLFASISTMIGFGLLSFSSVPVLSAIGLTVGLGAILALAFSAVLARRAENDMTARA